MNEEEVVEALEKLYADYPRIVKNWVVDFAQVVLCPDCEPEPPEGPE